VSAKKGEKKEFLIFAAPQGEPLPKELKEQIEEGVRLGVFANAEPKPIPQLRPLANIILSWARRGDWNTLAEYILHDGRITDEIRKFLASILKREIKAPNNRAPSFRTFAGPGGLLERVRFFVSLVDQGVPREQAVDLTAEKFGVDRRSVRRDLKQGEDPVRFLIALREVQFGAWERHRAHCTHKRYSVCPAALTAHFLS
jgi:hypothetical protein